MRSKYIEWAERQDPQFEIGLGVLYMGYKGGSVLDNPFYDESFV